jgi:hypothetical protein|tara:strand:- start:237 stop:560 length:324 start_codon:yes stop_codon:yes gene_type:complete
MKFLNKEPRHQRHMRTDIPEWQKDYSMEQKLGDIKLMSNVQLSELKEVAEFYRLDMQLRIYKLKEQNLLHVNEAAILDSINNHIKDVDEHMTENDKDNYWSLESFGK